MSRREADNNIVNFLSHLKKKTSLGVPATESLSLFAVSPFTYLVLVSFRFVECHINLLKKQPSHDFFVFFFRSSFPLKQFQVEAETLRSAVEDFSEVSCLIDKSVGSARLP